jgi:hypothetical protein
MKSFITTLTVVCLLSGFNQATLQAQATNRPPDRMKMLNAFNGEWKGEMVAMIEKKKVKYKLSHTSQKIAGGWGVLLSEVAMIPEKGKYQAARTFSYSTTGDTTFMYTVDSDGETHFFKGIWESTRRLLLKTSGESHGKHLEKTISYTFVSPKEYNYKCITVVEGKEDDIVEMKMMKE